MVPAPERVNQNFKTHPGRLPKAYCPRPPYPRRSEVKPRDLDLETCRVAQVHSTLPPLNRSWVQQSTAEAQDRTCDESTRDEEPESSTAICEPVEAEDRTKLPARPVRKSYRTGPPGLLHLWATPQEAQGSQLPPLQRKNSGRLRPMRNQPDENGNQAQAPHCGGPLPTYLHA